MEELNLPDDPEAASYIIAEHFKNIEVVCEDCSWTGEKQELIKNKFCLQCTSINITELKLRL